MNHFWQPATLNKILGLATAFVALFALGACEKSNGTIGSDKFVDDRPELGTKLQYEAVSYTAYLDSVTSAFPAQVTLGKFNDPLFGTTNASFSARILLSKASPDFAPETVCDSVKLRLAFNGSYGIMGAESRVEVLPLLEPLIDTFRYYSNFVPTVGEPIGDTTLVMDPKSWVYNGVDSLYGYMAFDLDPTYFQEIIFDASIAGADYLASNDSFVAEVPGLHFRDIGNGITGMGYFDLAASGSLIQLYYHVGEDDTIPKVFSLTFGQNFGDPKTVVNSFEHEQSTAAFDYSMQDTVNGEIVTYTQGGAGAYTALEFPGLDTLIGKGYSINKAELKVHVEQGTASPYLLPNTMLCLMDMDSTRALIKDYSSSINGTGGGLVLGEYREFAYRFNVTRMVHDFVNVRKEVYPLILTPSAGGASVNRAVLGGGMHPHIPVEFSVYYTKSE